MKTNRANRKNHLKPVAGGCLIASVFLGEPLTSSAQSVLMGPPPTETAPLVVQEQRGESEFSVFQPNSEVRDASLKQPFKYGPFVFRPHPYYRVTYGDGLQSGTNTTVKSVIQEIGAGFTVDLGRHWALDYTPTLRVYSSKQFRDSLDHSASLSGSTRYENWSFNFAQTFAQTDTTLAQTAVQTEQQRFDTTLQASRALNDKMYAEFGLYQKFNFVSGLQNSRDWSTMNWLNYRFNPRLTSSVGAGIGYVNVDVGPDQFYGQVQGRVQWRATDKLSFSVNAGFEDRMFLATGFGDALNPLFGASLQYAPFEYTQISLSAARTVSSSDYSLVAQATETTTVSLNLSQRVLEKFYLTGGLGYTRTDYTTAFGSLSAVRNDDNYFFNARLSRSFLKRGTMAVSYQYTDNRSTATGFTFASNQVGFEVGFNY